MEASDIGKDGYRVKSSSKDQEMLIKLAGVVLEDVQVSTHCIHPVAGGKSNEKTRLQGIRGTPVKSISRKVLAKVVTDSLKITVTNLRKKSKKEVCDFVADHIVSVSLCVLLSLHSTTN